MIKANSKYTAGEILVAAKQDSSVNQDAKFGELRIIIGGLAGIGSEDKIITIPATSSELEVIIGDSSVTLPLEINEGEMFVSEAVKTLKDASVTPAPAEESVE